MKRLHPMKNHMLLLLAVLCIPLSAIELTAQVLPKKEVVYLSGTDNETTETWEFFCTGGRKSGAWTTIEVPSCWEQQGFGTYNYGRDYVTYGRGLKYADEQGLYRHRFLVPASWKERVVRIVFEGSMTDTEVLVNGEPAGPVHRGSFYRFSYDITPLLKFGQENLLEVTVSKMSSDPTVNSAERYADYWIFGGIFRPVYLESYPEQHIRHATVWGDMHGVFQAEVELGNPGPGMEVTAEVLGPDGQVVSTCSIEAGDGKPRLEASVEEPLLWTAESPHLYKARFTLRQNDRVLHVTEEVFGFRTVEIRSGDGIYLNGVKIRMKGINRHAFWPETGRSLNRRLDRMDVELMKEMNMNAVRCSHYPPDKSFLELCDSLGLYVLDELAGWQNAYGTETGKQLVREMVRRDVNHPSVIFWSNGNEGGTNKELDPEFLKHDPTGRQVVHCHHRPGNDFNGIETNHYESYQSTKEILQDSLIYMTTEFLHGQNDGGAGAGLYDYWELMRNSPLSAGGFLWVFADEAVVRTDWDGALDANLVNAPDGVVGPHREKEGSFFAIREIWSPVVPLMEEIQDDFTGQIPLENRYHFTALDECSFRWELQRFPSPYDGNPAPVVLHEGQGAGPETGPGETGRLQIDLPENWREANALSLEAIDPHGKPVIKRVWPVGDQTGWIGAHLSGEEEVSISETDSTVTMASGQIVLSISKQTGLLDGVWNNRRRRTSFRNGPVPVSGTCRLKSISHGVEDKRGVVRTAFMGTLQDATWTMHPGGWVELTYTYQHEGEMDHAGISFDFEEGHVMSACWLGQGPYRVWKNRMAGGVYGRWEKAYNQTIAGTPPWHFPEFKGYHADVRWMELNTLDGKILVAAAEPDLFVRLFDFHAFPAPTLEPELPPGDLSFLDAIPPTGTKMSLKINASADSTGPQGAANRMEGSTTRTLYFNFGIL